MTEWKHSLVDLADDITTIVNVPALFKGYYVHTVLSAHLCPIEDDTTGIFQIPASAAANTLFELNEPVRFETKLVVDPDNSATGKVVIIYRELGRHN